MQREVSGEVRPLYGSLGVKGLMSSLLQLSILLFFRPHDRYATSHLSALFTIYTRDAEILSFEYGRCQLSYPSFRWSPFVKCSVHKKLRSFWMKSSRCVLILYIHFIIYIYIYFRQHSYVIKAWVRANTTCFDLKSHPQFKLRTMKFFTVWLLAFGIPDGLQFLLWFVSCT